MTNRRPAILLAVVALVGSACGGAAPTASTTASAAATAAATVQTTAIPTPAASVAHPMGRMSNGRSLHTATALAEGRVLLAGGYFADVPIASAELFDPSTGAFTTTGAMARARGFDTATRLLDARVLVAGGNPGNWDFSGSLIDSAELYDPATGTFAATGSMTTARDVHTATLLLDGRVLITGGDDVFLHPLASAELYDPRTGTFSPTGSMSEARDFHVATLLADGRVLIAGGSPWGMRSASGQFLASAEVYDPVTGTFSPTGSMATPRVSHSATPLADGRVLIAGGAVSVDTGETGTNSLASAELYDPKTGTFSATGSMLVGRTFQAASLLADGRVLMTGGSADGWSYNDNYFAEAEIYDPTTGEFTATGTMSAGRVAQSATLLADGRVLVAGGRQVSGDVATAELWNPTTGTFSPAG